MIFVTFAQHLLSCLIFLQSSMLLGPELDKEHSLVSLTWGKFFS